MQDFFTITAKQAVLDVLGVKKRSESEFMLVSYFLILVNR